VSPDLKTTGVHSLEPVILNTNVVTKDHCLLTLSSYQHGAKMCLGFLKRRWLISTYKANPSPTWHNSITHQTNGKTKDGGSRHQY
jgi:hypothetical protein